MASVDVNALVAAQAVDESGSKKTMIYTSDTTVQYLTTIDENIGEAMGFTDYTGAQALGAMPDGLEMRKVTFASSSGKVKGSYPVGTPTTPIFAEGGTITVPRKGSAAGLTCAVTGAQGERRRLLSGNDTGQNAGDIS